MTWLDPGADPDEWVRTGGDGGRMGGAYWPYLRLGQRRGRDLDQSRERQDGPPVRVRHMYLRLNPMLHSERVSLRSWY